jgi:membrane protein implicated in regulation of membrane protease activity
MLILQVALGIVLAVLLLAFLPTLVKLGFGLLVIAVGLGIAALLVSWILDDPILMVLAIAAVIILIVREHRNGKRSDIQDFESIRQQIQRRAMLGYESKSLEEKMYTELKSREFDSAAQRERARRRALGYPK